MVDIFTKEKRSDIMSRIKWKETKVERLVFSYLRKNKIYFQKHYNLVKGCPDLAVPSRKLAVFIDGDFWHGWKFAAKKPKLPEFWVNKIETNMKRDRKNRTRLKRAGWKVLKVWEHELKAKTREKYLKRIGDFLKTSK